MILLYSPQTEKTYFTVSQLIKDFPDIVYEEGVKRLLPEGHPPFAYPLTTNSIDTEYDKETQRKTVTDIQAALNDDDTVDYYYRDEVIVDLTEDEIEAAAVRAVTLSQRLARYARGRRDKLLTESDWVVTKAFETETSVPTKWKEYRQALRDVTEQEGFPLEVNWPTEPE